MPIKKSILGLFLFVLLATIANAQSIPTPKEHFGFSIGDNYQLTTFTQTEAYFKKLDAASDKAKYTVIGKTEEGRDQFMLIVTSPENHKKLEHYRSISQKLGNAAGLTDEQARALANEGKAVVWIDGGLHATETAGIHQLIETAYTVLSRNDDETKRILDNVIILMTHANPDGHELVSNWYMRNPVPERRSTQGVPRLYQKYVGHDNNRDFYMLNMKESQNIGRQLFVDWIPQIMYNHHQSGPAGSIVAGAPFRDPFNYVFDPLVITGLDAIGAAKQTRLNAEGKPGYTSKSGSVFSTWYNGGLRTTTYFHNILGLLTEIVGSPNPSDIPLVPSRLVPNSATPFPVTPRKWFFRNTIDYSVSLNYAVLDYAARNRDTLLFNIYKMGKNSIERGSKDYWALSPSKVDRINDLVRARPAQTPAGPGSPGPGGQQGNAAAAVATYEKVMADPELRDPRGYIIPANQPAYGSAIEFLNALIRTGVVVHKATAEFTVGGKTYPANSFVVKTDQAFRPHVLDMFEPQDHPNDFQYPGGPPVPPYDAAGWTLAYQMGFQFDRVLDGFDGPFERNPLGQLITLTGKIIGPAAAKGYVLDSRSNNSFKAVNQLLKEGVEVYRVTDGSAGAAGSFFIPSNAKAKTAIDKAVGDAGAEAAAIATQPSAMQRIAPARIALWDTYGGSMPSGWIRWIMERYNYSIDVIYPGTIDAGDLNAKYDVIVFVGGSIPGVSASGNQGGGQGFGSPNPDSIPEEYRARLGRITAQRSVPELKKFLEHGGKIVTIGSATNLAYHLKLPVSDALVEIENGVEKNLPREKYYVPGSILRVNTDPNSPATWGMNPQADVYFNASPVFNISPGALSSGSIRPLLWFDGSKPLRSGWAWGQSYLLNKVTGFEAKVGTGNLYAFGPEITFRAQAHGTFKLLFNQLYKVTGK